MPEESTFRKYACTKLKLSKNCEIWTLLNWHWSILCKSDQNKIFPELNSKKHKPSPAIWFLRNCGIAQNSSFRKSGIGQFCAKWLSRMIAQIVVFSRKTDAQRKINFAFRSVKIAQKFCEWKGFSFHFQTYLNNWESLVIYFTFAKTEVGIYE